MIDATQVAGHYAGTGLRDRVEAALDAAGLTVRPATRRGPTW